MKLYMVTVLTIMNTCSFIRCIVTAHFKEKKYLSMEIENCGESRKGSNFVKMGTTLNDVIFE